MITRELVIRDYNKLKKSEWTCYLTSTIKIPITQQFYKEKETTKNNKTTITFTGFKFYYRSVNINDPFPNEKYDECLV